MAGLAQHAVAGRRGGDDRGCDGSGDAGGGYAAGGGSGVQADSGADYGRGDERFDGRVWHVPKVDLMAGLQGLLERGELRISREMREASTLVRELVDHGRKWA